MNSRIRSTNRNGNRRGQNGGVLQDYERDSCPVDVQFKDNTIELVFKRTVQVLKYVTF